MSNNPYTSPATGDSQSVPRSQGCFWTVLILCGIAGLLVLLLLPMMSRGGARSAARRTQCKNNLKQIGLALHQYREVHGVFPPAQLVDDAGRKLHSWRTLILPYLDEQHLYDSIDLTKPWNHPVNATAYESRPEAYGCPSAKISATHTTYMALVGDDHFLSERTARSMKDIVCGMKNTLAVIEVPDPRAFHWMKPRDVAVDFARAMQSEIDVAHEGGIQVLTADGSARFIRFSADPDLMQQLISISDTVTAKW